MQNLPIDPITKNLNVGDQYIKTLSDGTQAIMQLTEVKTFPNGAVITRSVQTGVV